jgi:hypothetical protein
MHAVKIVEVGVARSTSCASAARWRPRALTADTEAVTAVVREFMQQQSSKEIVFSCNWR